MYYSTIIRSNVYLQVIPERDEAAWLEKAVLAAIIIFMQIPLSSCGEMRTG
jgi:hypothetical protein